MRGAFYGTRKHLEPRRARTKAVKFTSYLESLKYSYIYCSVFISCPKTKLNSVVKLRMLCRLRLQAP